jgi:hypothetical protein
MRVHILGSVFLYVLNGRGIECFVTINLIVIITCLSIESGLNVGFIYYLNSLIHLLE